MAALAKPRNTPRAAEVIASYSIPVADNVKIYPGALIVLNAGYAAPATVATGLIAVGRCSSNKILDNTVTGHAAGAFNVPVESGEFVWDIKTGDEVAQADVGAACFITDDHTVCKTSTGSSCAGRVVRIDGTTAVVRTFLGMALT